MFTHGRPLCPPGPRRQRTASSPSSPSLCVREKNTNRSAAAAAVVGRPAEHTVYALLLLLPLAGFSLLFACMYMCVCVCACINYLYQMCTCARARVAALCLPACRAPRARAVCIEKHFTHVLCGLCWRIVDVRAVRAPAAGKIGVRVNFKIYSPMRYE